MWAAKRVIPTTLRFSAAIAIRQSRHPEPPAAFATRRKLKLHDSHAYPKGDARIRDETCVLIIRGCRHIAFNNWLTERPPFPVAAAWRIVIVAVEERDPTQPVPRTVFRRIAHVQHAKLLLRRVQKRIGLFDVSSTLLTSSQFFIEVIHSRSNVLFPTGAQIAARYLSCGGQNRRFRCDRRNPSDGCRRHPIAACTWV